MSTENQQPYDSDEEDKKFILRTNAQYERYKRKAAVIAEDYFYNHIDEDHYPTYCSLGGLEPRYHHFFIRRIITAAMQRGIDKDKEAVAVCLSSIYGYCLPAKQYEKGFRHLLESIDFLIADIPDAAETLALFLTRALIDNILPDSFLEKTKPHFKENSKGLKVIEKVEEYLTLPENDILGKWGGEIEKPDNLKETVKEFMEDYIETENKMQTYRDIKALGTRAFNQEVLKYALVTALERRETERCLYALLKKLNKRSDIDTCQAYKGFDRVVDLVNEKKLDHVPKVRKLMKSLIVKAEIDRWLEAKYVKPILLPDETSTL